METDKQDNDLFDELDKMMDHFDGVVVDKGADPASEDDTCAGGACKI